MHSDNPCQLWQIIMWVTGSVVSLRDLGRGTSAGTEQVNDTGGSHFGPGDRCLSEVGYTVTNLEERGTSWPER